MIGYKKIIFIVMLLTIIGGVLRFFGNTKNPPSLNIDEVSYGYSAYSILKTGRDENGVFMPLSFRSVGDYKNPVLIYSLVPSIAVFGLNEFSIRFTTVLMGALTIPVFFLLLLLLIKNRKVALLGAALLTISPWHIYYSRFASDHIMGLFFLILGIYFFQKIWGNRKIWAILSGITLVLSMYTYHTQRLFVPMFVLLVLITKWKKLKSKKSSLIIFIATCFILVLPLIYMSIFKGANARAGMVFLSQDIDYTRYVILDHLHKPGEVFLLFFFWAKRYLNYFQPVFLFFNGLSMTISGTLGAGVLYLYELPWFILGIIEFIKRKIENKGIILAWVLLGIIPASLTNNEQSPGRSLIILPIFLLIISFGAIAFLRIIKNIKNKIFKVGFVSAFAVFIGVILMQTFLVFFVHFPLERGEAFMEGTKESIIYALENKDKYNEIVYDPYRGIEAQYIVNIPHIYFLFYSKYDPANFQQIFKYHGNEVFSFDKFTFRRINWSFDRNKKNILFIGSPWSLPEKDLKKEEILKKIYLSNGDLALLVVTPSN